MKFIKKVFSSVSRFVRNRLKLAKFFFSGKTKTTLLHDALSKGDQEFVRFMIANGAKVDSVDESGTTLLHRAVLTGNKELAEWMIVNGAKVDVRDIWGRTSLHLAVSRGD